MPNLETDKNIVSFAFNDYSKHMALSHTSLIKTVDIWHSQLPKRVQNPNSNNV